MQIVDILKQTEHRSFPYPKGKWAYYQEWNNALFLHWEVPYEVLQTLVPNSFSIDTFNGKAYVSLVAFTMQKIRPRYLPSVKILSDFDEINIRTYINNDEKPGVYFLNIEVGKTLSAKTAKLFSGLPYEKARMQREKGKYSSSNSLKKFSFETHYKTSDLKQSKTKLDHWLTERYCLYLNSNKQFYRYDIHHLEWPIQSAELHALNLNYQIGDLKLTTTPDLCHYAKGVKVLAWPKEKLTF